MNDNLSRLANLGATRWMMVFGMIIFIAVIASFTASDVVKVNTYKPTGAPVTEAPTTLSPVTEAPTAPTPGRRL